VLAAAAGVSASLDYLDLDGSWLLAAGVSASLESGLME